MRIRYKCIADYDYASWEFNLVVGDIIEVHLDGVPDQNNLVPIRTPYNARLYSMGNYILRNRFEPIQPEEELICDFCGEPLEVSEMVIINTRNKYLIAHKECAKEEVEFCSHCRYAVLEEDFDEYSGLCSHCYDSTEVCADCGYRYDRGVLYYSGREDDWFCADCLQENNPLLPKVYGYEYKPYPEFYGYDESGRYFGVELEVEYRASTGYDLTFLGEVEQLYLKEDGSLNDGFEVVTHPMSMDYMMNFQWKEIVDELRKAGYQSHKPGSCGLHIHVSREAFSPDGVQDEDIGIGRLLFFVAKFEPELIKLSRRRSGQLESWARFEYFDSQDDEDACQKAKDMKYSCGRYRAINLQNDETVEFRFWRGTLKYNTLMATFQLTNAMVEIAVTESIKDIDAKDWNYFVENYFNTVEIKQYMKERGMM